MSWENKKVVVIKAGSDKNKYGVVKKDLGNRVIVVLDLTKSQRNFAKDTEVILIDSPNNPVPLNYTVRKGRACCGRKR